MKQPETAPKPVCRGVLGCTEMLAGGQTEMLAGGQTEMLAGGQTTIIPSLPLTPRSAVCCLALQCSALYSVV